MREARQAAYLPDRITPVEPEAFERASFRKRMEGLLVESCLANEGCEVRVRRLYGFDALPLGYSQALDVPKPHPHPVKSMLCIVYGALPLLLYGRKSAIPLAFIDVDGPDFYAMAFGVFDQRGRGVKPHRLGV
jgi:hypothetical protein